MFEKAKSMGFRRLRHVLGLVLLSALILISAADFAIHWNRHNVWQDTHSTTIPELIERRLAKLMEHLPARGAVGYIGDESRWDYATTFKVVAQYVLAPLVVEDGLRHELIVGNFLYRPDVAEVARRRDLIILEDFGDGVVLFKRVAQ
jgi:hypothetical protein